MLVGVEPVLQIGDLREDDVVLLEKFGVLGGECVEALLVVGLVLRDSGVGGDQFFNYVGGCASWRRRMSLWEKASAFFASGHHNTSAVN